MEERGAIHLGAFSCVGVDRYVTYMRRGFLFSAGHPNETELAEAETFGKDIGRRWPARDPESSVRASVGTSVGAPVGAPVTAHISAENDVGWIYRLERLLTGPVLARQVYSRLFRLDRRRCTGCGACARRCPVGNITLDSHRQPNWGRECTLCLYCEMICPEEAITSPVGLPPFDAFVTHNIRAAAADPNVDHVRVVHEAGRTRLLADPTPRPARPRDEPGG